MANETLLIIRIRGEINLSNRVKDTLRMLRIDKNNYATLIDNRPSYMGMLKEAKDCVTWGEPDRDTIELLLKERGRIEGGKKLTLEELKKQGSEDFEELAQKIYSGDKRLNEFGFIKPYFRLHPPKGGFKKTLKRDYTNRGELGYRGKAINELAKRMC